MSDVAPRRAAEGSFDAWRAAGGMRPLLQLMRERNVSPENAARWLARHTNLTAEQAYRATESYRRMAEDAARYQSAGAGARPKATEIYGNRGRVGDVQWWFRVRYRDDTGAERTMYVASRTNIGASLGEARSIVTDQFADTVRARAARDKRNYPLQGEPQLVGEPELALIERLQR